MKGSHSSNLVSLVAPVAPNPERLFQWDNNFSWSYNGDTTDSIKQRVKAAGGKVDGDLRVSLSWFNSDDLDIHIKTPTTKISFSRKVDGKGGRLDVDMNAGGKNSATCPVENVTWADRKRMSIGDYEVIVNQYSKRNTQNGGFVIEVEHDGVVQTFSYDKVLRQSENVKVITLHWDGKCFTIKQVHGNISASGGVSQEIWGINTEEFVKVSSVMLSPNHWEGTPKTGNRHFFFMLEDCINPDRTRGFYNEFLRKDLTEDRKAFEMIADKFKCEESTNQLSGLGFSSTLRNSLVVRVKGDFNRTIKLKF
jgi:hypothetical protein